MRLLLDTRAFLWWRMGARLSSGARLALQGPGNDVFVSAVVAWEIVVKRALGKLEFRGSVDAAIADEGFRALPLAVAHVDELAALPDHHRDPFDRALSTLGGSGGSGGKKNRGPLRPCGPLR